MGFWVKRKSLNTHSTDPTQCVPRLRCVWFVAVALVEMTIRTGVVVLGQTLEDFLHRVTHARG